jgi:hypothetical protein
VLELDDSIVTSQNILAKADKSLPEFSLKDLTKLRPIIHTTIRPTVLSSVLDGTRAASTVLQGLNLPAITTGLVKTEKSGKSNSEAFIEYLKAASSTDADSSSEGFSLKKALTVPKSVQKVTQNVIDQAKATIKDEGRKIVTDIVRTGIQTILSAESSFPEASISGADRLDGSIERALLANAVLTAVTEADTDVLQAEGFFDSIVKAVGNIAPKVLPHILPKAGPSIFDIINKTLKVASGIAVNNGIVGPRVPEVAQPGSDFDVTAQLWSVLKASNAAAQ